MGGQKGQMQYDSMQFERNDAVIPCTLLTSLIQYAQHKHIAYAPWFCNLNYTIEAITQGQALVSFDDIEQVFLNAQTDITEHALGIELVKSSGLGSMGLLGFVMQASQNTAQAFDAGLRFHRISGSVMNISVIPHQEQVILRISPRYPSHINIVFFEEISASIVNCLKALLGEKNQPLAIDFAYPKPLSAQQYADFFQCPIQFGQKQTQLYFAANVLDKPIITANAANYHQALRICQQQLEELERQTVQHSLAHQVYNYLEKRLPVSIPLHEVATHFSLSERHLRRKLAQEQHSFQQIKQRVLFKHAQKLLLEQQSIEMISEALGFSEAREFRRAFKRWTKLSPSAFRQQQK